VVSFGRYDHGDRSVAKDLSTDNTCLLFRYPFDGPGLTLAHAYYPYDFGPLGGDVHFDEDEPWSPTAFEDGGTDFFTVAVHEIGHALGLSHSPETNSVMFPYYRGAASPKDFSLGYDDILGMYELYGNNTGPL